ncbi:MAG: hypothetical protein BWY04_01392 [candidate division CPR1 bacterium ADurb.Bin160]|uniref:Uncharacterized protein n=1 Tax=candidate division CPR1 bacterium ADurb.Bin160 TaxID=1852826 RepID=A0A1V5ZJD2_9BACT|nr:MAG: hypothetical protein BWY04_01392 [candidate division CPR1 bacterium ADurb.Bin160]
MKHPTEIENYDGDLRNLAREVTNLRYDSLTKFLNYISMYLKLDANKDLKRRNMQLYSKLHDVFTYLDKSINDMEKVWNICKLHMKETNENKS